MLVAANEADAWLAGLDPLRQPVGDWIDATAQARGPELFARLQRLAQCLRLIRAGGHDLTGLHELASALGSAGPDEVAITSELARSRDALAQALLRVPTRLAVLGLSGRAERPAPVAAGTPSPPVERAPGDPAAIHALTPGELLARMGDDVLGATGRLVDLGTGDGRSFAGIARRARAAELVAVDVAWSYTLAAANSLRRSIDALPPRASYVVLGPGGGPTGVGCRYVPVTEDQFRFADRLAAATVVALGEKSAEGVTLLYPMHVQQPMSDGTRRRAVLVQVATAMGLLADGGAGLVVTEDVGAWREVVHMLRHHPRVAEIAVAPELLDAAHLRAMGIEPYTFSAGELDVEIGKRFTVKSIPSSVAYAPAATASWGLAVLWRVA